MLANLKEFQHHKQAIEQSIQQEEAKNDPEDAPDRKGSTLLEVKLNDKYQNLRQVIEITDTEQQRMREK